MDVERLRTEELEKIQERKLKVLVHYVYSNSSFYRKRFKEAGVNPWDFKGLRDLEKLPFTKKQDLRDTYPTGMFAVPPSKIVRFHASSGTTGKPTVVGYTAKDLETWAECLARGLASCGLTKEDVLQISYGYGLFTGGFGFHYAAEKLGTAVIPASTGNTRRQLELMRDLKTTAIACTPSYMLYLAESMDAADINLRMGFFGAEPWSEETRKRIEEKTGMDAFDCYGSSELSGPLFTECREKAGFHIWADHFLIEIIDPETGERLGEGEKGELVVTTLSKEALPLIRWRTGDITHIDSERCACGRTHPRVGRIAGRSDDMLIVRGVNVFPSQIEHVLMEIPELAEHYMIFLDREKGLDVMKIQVELRSENNLDTDILRKKVARRLKSVLNLATEIEIVSPGKLQRFEGKARRVVDRREI
ncbi:MAG: phenylacetate--CoA ligase [Archaeoglobus sp.]|nr:phenylacetate--CoA ligase [Archaeoglobus sp.]